MTKWTIDPAHSEVGFRIQHLMISNVKGRFKKIAGEVESTTDDFKSSKISFTADIASLDTGSEQRDKHLNTAEFFNAEKYSELKFTGKTYDGRQLEGDLTIAGITKPVTLHAEFGGIAKDPYGNTKAGFSITGMIHRKDWGLTWNAALESGGVMVSDEVFISADIQLLKKV
ncbi:MAG TPA: YceI family protein [Cytophagaceae bacterium]|jgi:polyisoprenoid-binding protein YceI|nr:YceI family protein [Cytophagaceae bacterium]